MSANATTNDVRIRKMTGVVFRLLMLHVHTRRHVDENPHPPTNALNHRVDREAPLNLPGSFKPSKAPLKLLDPRI